MSNKIGNGSSLTSLQIARSEEGSIVLILAITPVLAILIIGVLLIVSLQRYQRELIQICRVETLKTQITMEQDLKKIELISTLGEILSMAQFIAQFFRFFPPDEQAYQAIKQMRTVLGYVQKLLHQLRRFRVLMFYKNAREKMFQTKKKFTERFGLFFETELTVLPPLPTAYPMKVHDTGWFLYEAKKATQVYEFPDDFEKRQEMTLSWFQSLRTGKELQNFKILKLESQKRGQICVSTLTRNQNSLEPRLAGGNFLLNLL